MVFLLKMKPEDDSGKQQGIDGTQPHRSGNQNTTMCSVKNISKRKKDKKKRRKKKGEKNKQKLHRSHTAEQSVWAQMSTG